MYVIRIEELNEENLNEFLDYLSVHLSENGDNNFFFLPLSKEQSKFTDEWEEKFRNGFNKKRNEMGWRKLWVAMNPDDRIIGHIDIRIRKEPNTPHRVVLGMGTDRNFRNLKIGQRLLHFVIDYCKNDPKISWLDLDVLGSNSPAIRVYQKLGFQLLSDVPDMFRIEGKSYGYKSMTLNVDTEL